MSEAARGRLIVALMVTIIGLITLLPNLPPVWRFVTADRDETTVARWVSSRTVEEEKKKDTVGIPTYAFTRKIGPMPQDCAVELLRYAHAPGGKPKFETMRVVAGDTCADLTFLDDPPRERMILVATGLVILLAGLWLLRQVRRGA